MRTNWNISFTAMNTVKAIAIVGVAAFLSSCSQRISSKQYYDDDVYFSSKDLRNYTPPALYPATDTGSYAPSNRYSNTASATPDYQNGQQVIDDYYDYQYAARIRRFYSPNYGMGYYDPYYTNTYWYNYNPYGFGTSVYMTYNFWPNSSYYWGYGNPYAYNPYDPWRNPMYGYNGYGGGYYGYGSPWMPYNPYASGWGYGNPYGYGGWGYNNGYYDGYNNGYYNGFNDGLANNNYYFNGYDNNSYNYYGPNKQPSNSGKFNSFGEQVQTAMTNDGDVLKFTPAIGSAKPTQATSTKPLNFNPATAGSKDNAGSVSPAKGNLGYINAPVNTGEKNLGNSKPNGTFDKPSITGKPIQVFDYNETAPASNKGNVGSVTPSEVKQHQNANFDNKPTQQPVYQNEKPSYNERPANIERPNNIDRPANTDRPSDRPIYNERPADRPTYNESPRNDRPADNYSAPQRPQQNYQTKPDRNDRPQYSAPQNNNRNNGGGNNNSAPSRGNPGSGGGNNGGNNGGRGNAGRPR